MNLFDLFRRSKPEKAAETARNRLQIVLAHERADRNAPDFLPQLQKELLEVIKKYIDIDDEKVAVKLQRESGVSMLEVNVELPGPRAGASRESARIGRAVTAG